MPLGTILVVCAEMTFYNEMLASSFQGKAQTFRRLFYPIIRDRCGGTDIMPHTLQSFFEYP
jgi:hypothetical protein